MVAPSTAALGVPYLNNQLAELWIGLGVITSNQDLELYEVQKKFQFWPETISDSRQLSYSDKAVPGGSHPIKQWTGGGSRTLSFQVVIARDSLDVDVSSSDNANDPYNVDVQAGLLWLRSMTYPAYDKLTKFASPPPTLLLCIPGSGIGAFSEGDVDSIYCVMTSCEVTYEAFFSDGTLRYISVQLGFEEVVQNENGVRFHSRHAPNAVAAIKRWTRKPTK